MEASAIDRVFLCFNHAATEDAFINSRSSRLSFHFSLCASTSFITASVTIWVNWVNPALPVGTASQESVYRHVQLWLGFCAAFSFLCIWVPCIPTLNARIGTRTREVIALSLVIFATACAVPADFVVMSRILGLDHEQVYDSCTCFSSDKLLLIFVCISAAVHNALPIRWFLLVLQEAATILIYVVVLILHDAADAKQHGFFNVLVLSFMVCCSSFGIRQMEKHEKKSFSTYIEEKQHRFQVEFQLSHLETYSKGQRSTHQEEVSSHPSNTLTDQLWCDSNQSLRSLLGSISSVGRAEQWLIESEGLRVNIDHLLGRGGFGLVFSGSFHGTPCAVKLPKNSILDQASRSEVLSLCTEIRIMRRLRHPNLVGFYGALLDAEHGGLALVMELVQGITLKDFVSSDGECNVLCDDRCRILFDLCFALRYLHSRRPRVVHGDLTHSNIMVAILKHGVHAKILDFGLSRLLTRNSKPMGGTMHWMAPEVVRRARPDTAADVFSFGLVAFFTATGVEPWRTVSEKTIKHLAKHGKVPHLAWPSGCVLGQKLMHIVGQCTEHEVTSRPTMTEVHSSICLLAKLPANMSNNMDDAERQGLRRLQNMFQGHLKIFDQEEKACSSGVALAHAQKTRNSQPLGLLEQVPENVLIVQGKTIPHAQQPENQPACQPCPLVAPRFRRTPKSSQLGFVLRLLLSLNIEADSSKCCAYHDALGELGAYLKKLGKSTKCNPAFFDDVVGQCSSCGLMTTAADKTCLFCDRWASSSNDDADGDRDHLIAL